MLQAARRCPVCESSDVRVFRAACADRLHETPGTWDLLRCRTCGIRFTDHRGAGDAMLAYYPPEYSVSAPEHPVRDAGVLAAARQAAIWPYRLRFGAPDRLPAPFGSRRALDVGCGTGDFLTRLLARGWDAHGLDFNADVVRLARSRAPGATVHHGTLERLAVPERFSYVALNHVLEHVARPHEVLRRCHALMEDGGMLSISVPNIESIEARVFGSRWRGLDIPRHLIHFDPRTLERLVRGAGFRVTLVRPALFASSLSESLLLTLPNGLKRRALRHGGLRRALYYLTVFPASLSYACGNAPVIELEATKQAAP